jgi:hypothetical protein
LIYRHTALVRATYSINVVLLAITKAASPILAAKRTCRGRLAMSSPEGKTDVPREPGHFRFWHLSDMPTVLSNVHFQGNPEHIAHTELFSV